MVRIVFTASNTLLGKIIRKLTKSPVSHVFVQYPSSFWGGDWVAEATFPMVMLRPAERARHNIHSEFKCLFDFSEAAKKNRSKIGNWYDIEGLVEIGWWLSMTRLFNRKIRRPIHATPGGECAEFITQMLKSIDYKLSDTDKLDPNTASPETVRQFCISHPTLFELVST